MPSSATATLKKYVAPRGGQDGMLVLELAFAGAYSDGRLLLAAAQQAKLSGFDPEWIDAVWVAQGPDNNFRLVIPTDFPTGASSVPNTVITAIGAGALNRPRMTVAAHELVSGDRVVQSGFTGAPAVFNGTFTVEVITSTTYDLREAQYNSETIAGSPVYKPAISSRIMGYLRLYTYDATGQIAASGTVATTVTLVVMLSRKPNRGVF